MTIFVTVGFSATFSVILYIAVAPFSGKISAQKHVCPPARHSRRVFVQLFDKFIITSLRRERNRIFFESAAAKLKHFGFIPVSASVLKNRRRQACFAKSLIFWKFVVDKACVLRYNSQRRRERNPGRPHEMCGRSSSGRAPPCQGGGSEFEPRRPLHFCGSLAQLGEHLPYKQRVSGSSPLTSTMWPGSSVG